MEDQVVQMPWRDKKRPKWSFVAISAVILLLIAGIMLGIHLRHAQENVPEETTSATAQTEASQPMPEKYEVQIALEGKAVIVLEYGTAFTDPGAQAVGQGTVHDGQPVPLEVTVQGTVDTQKLGSYTLTYSASFHDQVGSAIRTVIVQDTTAPVITLVSDPESYTLPGKEYQEEGYSAIDQCDGDLTDRVTVEKVDDLMVYSVCDASGNRAQVQRQIRYDDPVAPELKLKGSKKVKLEIGSKWKDPGCTAQDNVDGDLTDQIKITGSVDTSRAGTYELKYKVTDSYGNSDAVKRTVVVTAKQPQVQEPKGKVIYLTFDDGPWTQTDELLAVLDKYDVKATFFVCNTQFIDKLADIADAGHAIGIHSKTHDYSKIYSGEEAFFQDVYAMQDIIFQHTGVKTTLLRFPGGSSNRVSMRYCTGIMTRLVDAVQEKGFQYFDWNVDSDDAGGASTADQVFRNVIEGVKGQQYSVVLQHDTRGFSIAAVERIIQWGKENGYTFLPLEPDSPPCHHGWLKN